jgi:hypothetical protein
MINQKKLHSRQRTTIADSLALAGTTSGIFTHRRTIE